ncbi:hypothetical protein ACRRTK_010514 [Alexandromys fortis]
MLPSTSVTVTRAEGAAGTWSATVPQRWRAARAACLQPGLPSLLGPQAFPSLISTDPCPSSLTVHVNHKSNGWHCHPFPNSQLCTQLVPAEGALDPKVPKIRDNNGWSLQFDKYFSNISKLTPQPPSACLVGSVPKHCMCRDLELDCDGANLRAVPSVSANVTVMCLQNNKIRFVSVSAFRGLRSLTKLIIEDNHLSRISPLTFYGLNSLILLVMRKNKINHLSEHAFTHLQKLDELDLGSNRIENLPPNIFKDLKELTQLNISYNPIQKIQVNQFDDLSKLKSLYFKRFQYCGYAPHVRSCKPNTDGISSLENLLANIIQRVFVWVVSAVTCFGNIFVICMRPYIRSENKLHALSIISLCCADCLMGVYLFVIGAFDLKFRGEYNQHAQPWMESAHCQLMGSLAILSTEVSVLLLTFLTLEKYICIVYPFRCLRPRKCRTITVLTFIWIVGFIVAFAPLSNKEFFRNYYGTNGVCFPLHSEDSGSINLVAFIIIVFSYGSMFYSVHQSTITATEIQKQVKREVVLAKRFFLIVFTDALCWIPIFILKFLSLLQVEIPDTITSWVVIFILPINSALNPIIYTLTTRPFKEMIYQLWYNYRQRRSVDRKETPKAFAPSFIWVEMWPVQEMPAEFMKPAVFTDPCNLSLVSQSSRLNSYS